MFKFITCACVVAALSFVCRADTADNLQGTWRIVSMEMGGKALPKEKLGNAGFRFEGDKVIRVNPDGSAEKPIGYKVDTSHTPAWMDWTDTTGVSLGLFELSGDTLKLCMGPDPQPNKPSVRPGELGSKEGLLIVLERKKG